MGGIAGETSGSVVFDPFEFIAWLSLGQDLTELLYDYTDGACPHNADTMKVERRGDGMAVLTYRKEF